MSNFLDLRLSNWIEKEAGDRKVTVSEAAQLLVQKEVDNRLKPYSDLQDLLKLEIIDIKQMSKIVRVCTVMGIGHQIMNFNRFITDESRAQTLISRLIHGLPESTTDMEHHIDQAIERAVDIGYKTIDGKDTASNAATFVSLMLTAAYPERFVDFPNKKCWGMFAEYLGAFPPDKKDTYGKWIVWTSKLAQDTTQTEVFKAFWPVEDKRYQNPLWVISGLAWVFHHKDAKKPPNKK